MRNRFVIIREIMGSLSFYEGERHRPQPACFGEDEHEATRMTRDEAYATCEALRCVSNREATRVLEVVR